MNKWNNATYIGWLTPRQASSTTINYWFSDFKKMGRLFSLLWPKLCDQFDTEEKMCELTCFYSTVSFCALCSELQFDLNTGAVLPFLIINNINWAYHHPTILYWILKSLPSIVPVLNRVSAVCALLRYICTCAWMNQSVWSYLLCVECDISNEKNKVADRFATMKERMMKFCIYMYIVCSAPLLSISCFLPFSTMLSLVLKPFNLTGSFLCSSEHACLKKWLYYMSYLTFIGFNKWVMINNINFISYFTFFVVDFKITNRPHDKALPLQSWESSCTPVHIHLIERLKIKIFISCRQWLGLRVKSSIASFLVPDHDPLILAE